MKVGRLSFDEVINLDNDGATPKVLMAYIFEGAHMSENAKNKNKNIMKIKH